MNKLEQLIQLHEGSNVVDGVHRMYKCPADKWTIGNGHNVEDNGISYEIAQLILEEDIRGAEMDIHYIFGDIGIEPVRHAALVDMVFNMGRSTLIRFKKMIGAIAVDDWNLAADEAMDSRWYTQTGSRAKRIVEMLRSNEWPSELD